MGRIGAKMAGWPVIVGGAISWWGLTVKDRPEVHYAHNGDVAIAYQVFGEGPHQSGVCPGFHLQPVLELGAA
jgi:hypothetical protein